jgi:ABC-type sugar transport system substrate-binding protein
MQIAAVSRRVGVQHVGVIAQGQTGAGYTDYVQSVKRAAAAHANVKLEDIAYDNGTFTNDVTLVSNMLTAHPDINVVLNYSGFPGMLTAIQERHKVGKVFAFVSSDNPQATISYIDKGLVAGVRFIPACASGRLVVRSLLALRAGRRVPHQLSDGERIVTGAEFKRLVAKGAL